MRMKVSSQCGLQSVEMVTSSAVRSLLPRRRPDEGGRSRFVREILEEGYLLNHTLPCKRRGSYLDIGLQTSKGGHGVGGIDGHELERSVLILIRGSQYQNPAASLATGQYQIFRTLSSQNLLLSVSHH